MNIKDKKKTLALLLDIPYQSKEDTLTLTSIQRETYLIEFCLLPAIGPTEKEAQLLCTRLQKAIGTIMAEKKIPLAQIKQSMILAIAENHPWQQKIKQTLGEKNIPLLVIPHPTILLAEPGRKKTTWQQCLQWFAQQ